MLLGTRIAAAYEVEILEQNGDPANRIDIAILGDGYRTYDQQKMTDDAAALVSALWSETPFMQYRDFFNINLVHVVSNEDGADYGMYGPTVERDTALGAYFFCYDIEHLLCVLNSTTISVAAEHVSDFDVLVVMVNDTKYGGSGGMVSVFSVHANATEIMGHEFAHTFAGLADEYDAPQPDFPECSGDCPEPNASLHSTYDDIKWNPWIAPKTPLPTPETADYGDTVGAFEGCRYQVAGVFRPWLSCKMNVLGQPFCPVCAEAMVLGFYDRISPIDSYAPPIEEVIHIMEDESVTLTVAGPIPEPDTLRVSWQVDGEVVEDNSFTFVADGATLGSGEFEITALMEDTTPLVRNDPEALLQSSVTWAIRVGGPTVSGCGCAHVGQRDSDSGLSLLLSLLWTIL